MTRRFRKMCEVYKIFAKSWNCDFSEQAMKEMFEFESKGIGNIDISGFNATGKLPNGYAVGKKWLNVSVSMWFESFEKYGWYPTIKELYSDKNFPHWWLNEVFDKYLRDKVNFYEEFLPNIADRVKIMVHEAKKGRLNGHNPPTNRPMV